jgi:hypothetical protein
MIRLSSGSESSCVRAVEYACLPDHLGAELSDAALVHRRHHRGRSAGDRVGE